MAVRPLAFLLALLLTAGCFGGGDPKESNKTATNNTSAANATLPDGRGESLGNLETNKTEEGAGGIEHKHDYWKGKDNVVIFSDTISFGPVPLYPDGEGSEPKSVHYVKLDNNSFVFEGSDRVTVLAKPGEDPVPQPPALKLQYRSAADSTWRDAGNLAYDAPLEIKVAPKETDMPHSVLSLWVFRITTDGPTVASINLTITTHKGREVVDWPGHPDFYADSKVRVVADRKVVKTHMSGVRENYLYDQGGTWAAPDKLISYGTGKLLVIVNVTSTVSETAAQPTGFFLEAHNATIIGPEVTFGDRYNDRNDQNDLKHYEFEVPVDGAGMDGPYQPASRWGFRLMATFAQAPTENPVFRGVCPGCFGYDIEYELTVLAFHDEKAAAMVM